MEIIDCRNRPNTEEYLGPVSDPAIKAHAEKRKAVLPEIVSLKEWMSDVEEAGIAKAVFTGRDYETTSGWKVTNDYVASVVNRYPERVIGVAGLDALKGKAAVLELERAVKQLGLKGGSIDQARCGFSSNDRRLYPIYEKCLELDVPIFLTMGPMKTGSPLETSKTTYLNMTSPLLLDEVASDMPDLKILCSHGVWPYTQDMIAVAFRHRNVYIETSACFTFPGAELLWDAANKLIPDKVVFASAFPFCPMKENVTRFLEIPFTAEVKQKVMHDNAARLLKLET